MNNPTNQSHPQIDEKLYVSTVTSSEMSSTPTFSKTSASLSQSEVDEERDAFKEGEKNIVQGSDTVAATRTKGNSSDNITKNTKSNIEILKEKRDS